MTAKELINEVLRLSADYSSLKHNDDFAHYDAAIADAAPKLARMLKVAMARLEVIDAAFISKYSGRPEWLRANLQNIPSVLRTQLDRIANGEE